jgi:tetratricopeptide (TPR) repeat protein
MHRDTHGNLLSIASAEQAGEIDGVILGLAGLRADAFAAADALPETMASVPMAHILRATCYLMAAEAGAVPELRRSLTAASALARSMTDREQQHLQALTDWADGDFTGAARRYSSLSSAHPRDLLALQAGQQTSFFTGRQSELRDSPAAAIGHWTTGMPGHGYLLGMLAFGLEESGDYEAAEDAGKRAVEIDPRDGWAVHAVAHCHEMTGQTEAGIAWLSEQADTWAPGSVLAVHNWWHLALFHLELQDCDGASAIYDAHVARDVGAPALELVDASAMLWRLWLAGADVGARAAAIADAWDAAMSAPTAPGYYVFNDMHAAFAQVAAGRLHRAGDHLLALERMAAGPGGHAAVVRQAGLPLIRAIYALGAGDADGALDLLERHAGQAMAMGGSNAQRDVLALTLLAAAEISGNSAAMLAAARARASAKPASPFARSAVARARMLQRRQAA